MSPRFRASRAVRVAALALGLLTAALTLKPEPVRAQGLFDTLMGVLGRRGGGMGWLFPEEEMGGPYQAYCVRLCDGRFFPLPAGARGDRSNSSPENICKAMCPATPVRVFSGTQIDTAVSADGSQYARLQNAFVYREKMIAECTCNGTGNAGVASLDPQSDPTLQPGDIVVTETGPKVFRGAGRGQPTPASFVPVKEYKGMPETMRRNLSEMRITRTPEPVTARSSVAPSPEAAAGMPAADDIMMRGFIP